MKIENQPKCQKSNRGKSNPPIHKNENKDVGEINKAPTFVAIMNNLKKEWLSLAKDSKL